LVGLVYTVVRSVSDDKNTKKLTNNWHDRHVRSCKQIILTSDHLYTSVIDDCYCNSYLFRMSYYFQSMFRQNVCFKIKCAVKLLIFSNLSQCIIVMYDIEQNLTIPPYNPFDSSWSVMTFKESSINIAL